MPKKTDVAEESPLLLAVPREDAESRINERIRRGTEIRGSEIRNPNHLEEAQHEYYKWSDFNTELLKRLFTNTSLADEYSSWVGFVVGGSQSLGEKIQEFRDDVTEKLRRLDSIRERLELIPTAPQILPLEENRPSMEPRSRTKVFVVHGHDDAAKETAARFIERLGLEAIILHEQANAGRTIIEKLEHHADVDFALVLLTPDDVGAVASDREKLAPRARQNVVFELGLFIGHLGRKHVCALHKGALELPSDYQGVVYISMDSAGGWRLQVAKELREAGFEFDMNKAL